MTTDLAKVEANKVEDSRLLSFEERENAIRCAATKPPKYLFMTELIKVQDKKTASTIYEWGNQTCPHCRRKAPHGTTGSLTQRKRYRRECEQCWEELKG